MGLLGQFRVLAGGSTSKPIATGPDALSLIDQGNALEDEGHLDQALERYNAAIRLEPNLARAHLNRGNVLLEKDDTAGALAAYATALVHNSEYAAAHYNTGNAYVRSGRLEAALAAYNKTIALKPDFVDAEDARAHVLSVLGRLDEAVASCRRVLEFKPYSAELHCCLGNALARLGQLNEAVVCYRRAQELEPDYVEAHSNLGSVLHDLGQLGEAAASYRRALDLKADLIEVHGNLGNVLKDLGQPAEAAASYRRVLELQPDSAEAHSNLGVAMKDLGQFDDAIVSYRRALELNPDFAVAHNNVGSALKDLGQLDDSEASFRRALKAKPDYPEAFSNLLFLHICRASQSAAQSLSDALCYGEMAARRARRFKTWSNTPEPARCLRVGILSGDLRSHPVGHFLDGVLAALATEASGRLELYAYPSYFCSDEVTERIRAHVHGWRPAVGLSDETLARQILADRIDILIDLSGHTAHNRLPVFAWKPAPVQATWLGYLATTGVKAIDYLIADAWTLPVAEEAFFTEKIWRLPESYVCFTPPAESVDVGPLPALSNGYITFGSFNNLAKMNDAVVALWSRVLAAVPDSRLYLKSKQLQEAPVRQSVTERFARHGIDGARLILEGLVPRADYLKPFQRLDIALDPFPYPGITTSVECLWMGVPVLTLAGNSFLSRQGVGLLMNAGLPDWIAVDADDYVARAMFHASDLSCLAVVRKGLRQQVLASPVFDAPRFARSFEAALRGMWQRWCAEQQDSAPR